MANINLLLCDFVYFLKMNISKQLLIPHFLIALPFKATCFKSFQFFRFDITMTLLSKPYKITFQLIGSYLSQLYLNPIRTKSITSCVIALLGNYTAQRLSGAGTLNYDTLRAFGIFGLLFGGTIPHYFYDLLARIISSEGSYAPFQQLIIERLIYMPLYSFFSLYMINRLEGKSHKESIGHVWRVYFPIVEANIRYLTVLQYLNLYFVPPMLRVLVNSIIGFFWVVYLAGKRASKKSR